jgi:hypothetical protein
MGLGFELTESFTGTFHLFEDPMRDLPIELSLRLGVDGLRRFLRQRRISVAGTIRADGLAASGKPVHGTASMRLFDERRLPYDLSFEGDDGARYHVRGQRDFFVHDALESLTVLPASLYDDAGDEIGRATLRFDPRTELGTTVRSFRPRVRVPLLSRSRGDADRALRGARGD